MLIVGQPFPDFSLPDQDGVIRTLAEFLGQKVVLYFYPKDDTSGCTAEACEFQETMPRFKGATVIGVSPDSVKSHKKFAEKYGLKFILLADVDQTLLNKIGVWKEKTMYGKKYMGVERTTFLVDADGCIVRVWNKVNPAGHAEEVLEAIKG